MTGAVIAFRTSFANRFIGRGTVTLEREGDVWCGGGHLIA